MRNGGYFRTPTVRGDTVVFVSEDDLWTVPLAGGVARRLTAGLGDVQGPALSPDGSLLAFSSREEFHLEVFVMPAAGGQPTRVTYLGGASRVVGWTPEGDIVFRSDHGQPFVRILELHAVSPEGGPVRTLGYGPANEIAFGDKGAVVLGRNTTDPARWKRYRGGTVGHLWIDTAGKGTFKRLPQFGGNIAHPMWIDGRVYFISDHEGIGNVYSCTPAGRSLRRHTDHGEHYARFASSDGAAIVYAHAAELWALDPGADEPRRIEVDFPSPRTQRNRKFVNPARFLQGSSIHPDGHSVAVEARGKVFAMPLWDGAVREFGAPTGVRYRLGRWLADGKRVVLISDEDGTEALEVHREDGKRKRFAAIDVGRARELVANPRKDDLIALANHRNEVILVDLKASKATVVERNEFGRPAELTWSPDGAWLAYSSPASQQTRSIRLVDAASGEKHWITPTDFRDYEPAFDPDGRYLYFVSYRTFDPVPDAHFFDLSFPRGGRVYCIALQADAPDPFVTPSKGFGDDGEGGAGKQPKGKPKKDEPMRVDLEGITDRVAVFPVPEARYVKVVGIKGKALFLTRPIQGMLGSDALESDEPPGSLEVYDFNEQKHDTLAAGVADFEVARDGATLLYTNGHRLRAIKAGDKPDPSQEREGPSRKSGWIDLGRIRLSIDPGAEWRQMYREAWRLQQEHFWTENLSGVDWKRVYERYRPLVDKVATRLEFSDLIWEMQGELGTSHCYEMGGDHRVPPTYRMGFLGADLRRDAKGRWVIERIVRGDPWDASRTSPLAAIGAAVKEGETLLGVNGRAVGDGTDPRELLVNQAGQRVELTIGDPAGRNPRAVVVKTLTDETPARYREWVERNRARVHEATNGRVGYVHIPNMSAIGYSEFHRYYLSEIDRQGLIVDVRYNGGGFVSQIIIEKLARKRIGYDIARWGKPEPYPADSVLGPIIAITNEHAGSDGDIFTHVFKLVGIGEVVGKRTWGGVVGISPTHMLADGAITTQPEYAFWFTDVGWGVENYGTDPDHDVDITPQDYAKGRDPQMDTALSLMKGELKRRKPALPDFRDRPTLALPTLPPRARP